MTENHRQSDTHEDFDLPESLVSDLRTAMGPLDAIPGEADDRILANARRNLGRHRRLRLVASVAALTAAAAAIALVFLLPSTTPAPRSAESPGAERTQIVVQASLPAHPPTEIAEAEQPENSAGAKRTQTQNPDTVAQLTATPEDIDASGRVDILDALTLARHIDRDAAFRPAWDLNADGHLDQHDIDAIAARAVRLNPEEATP